MNKEGNSEKERVKRDEEGKGRRKKGKSCNDLHKGHMCGEGRWYENSKEEKEGYAWNPLQIKLLFLGPGFQVFWPFITAFDMFFGCQLLTALHLVFMKSL